MKISELLKELEKVKAEYGDLNTWLHIYGPEGWPDLSGDLNDLVVEERSILFLISDKGVTTP